MPLIAPQEPGRDTVPPIHTGTQFRLSTQAPTPTHPHTYLLTSAHANPPTPNTLTLLATLTYSPPPPPLSHSDLHAEKAQEARVMEAERKDRFLSARSMWQNIDRKKMDSTSLMLLALSGEWILISDTLISHSMGNQTHTHTCMMCI